MNENEISYQIIGAAIKVHRGVGPGLLESAYENALAYELQSLDYLWNNKSHYPSSMRKLNWKLVTELI